MHTDKRSIRRRTDPDRPATSPVGDQPNRDLRVFGGFDPDEAYYGYEDGDGDPLDLPVAAARDHFVGKASVPADAIRGR